MINNNNSFTFRVSAFIHSSSDISKSLSQPFLPDPVSLTFPPFSAVTNSTINSMLIEDQTRNIQGVLYLPTPLQYLLLCLWKHYNCTSYEADDVTFWEGGKAKKLVLGLEKIRRISVNYAISAFCINKQLEKFSISIVRVDRLFGKETHDLL
jgi:hypothetical protein